MAANDKDANVQMLKFILLFYSMNMCRVCVFVSVRLCICERKLIDWTVPLPLRRRNMYATTAKIAPTISLLFSFLRFYDDGDDRGGEGSGRIFLCPTKREPLPDAYD